MHLVSPAVVNCIAFQGFCRRPWTKGQRQKQLMFIKQNTDKIQFLTFLRVIQNTQTPTISADKYTHSAPNFNLGKKRKSPLSSHSQTSTTISLATSLSLAALFDPIMFAFLLKLGSQSARCPVDQPPYPLPSLNAGKEKKKENYGGSDSYYLYVKISKDYRFRWDLRFLIQTNDLFRDWCYKSY